VKRLLLVTLLLLTTACTTTIPVGLTLSPPDDAVAGKVARLAAKSGCRLGLVALHVESGRRLAWNEGESFEAASVIKLALLVEAVARVKTGELDLTDRWNLSPKAVAAGSGWLDEFEPGLEPTYRDLLNLMIGISDNTAANSFIDRFGAEAINHRMRALGLPGIQLVGRIPDRDPKETESARWKGLKLGAMTPHDTAELYRRVVTRTLLDPRSDARIEDVLRKQHYVDRVPRYLLKKPGTSWAGKTGTMNAVRNDSGILTTPKGRFVLVAFADRIDETADGVPKAREAMAEIARTIVDAWSATLPDLPKPVEEPRTRILAPALARVEVTPREVNADTPYVDRVYRDTDRRFWDLYQKAGGQLDDSCLIPMPNSWWEGDDGQKIQPISSIILHHTADETDEECIALFQKPESLVSSHFLVGREGRLYQFVSLEHRSWHAGASRLHGRRSLNKTSAGIEITGDGNLHPFTREQIDTVTRVVAVLVAMFDVRAPWIAGHQHVAPDRKPDPGELFPWNEVLRRSLDLAETLKRLP